MKTLYIIDIDGTVADATNRYKKAGKEPSRKIKKVYNGWVTRVQNERSLMKDKPVNGMIHLLNSLPKGDVRYVTGREHKWSHITWKWLQKQGLDPAFVHHRKNGDYRSAAKVKEEVILRTLRIYPDYTTVIIVDDDPKGDIGRMAKKHGYTFLKAKSGS